MQLTEPATCFEPTINYDMGAICDVGALKYNTNDVHRLTINDIFDSEFYHFFNLVTKRFFCLKIY